MSSSLLDRDRESEIKDFHLPRWNEIPNIDLYLDQVICYLEKYLLNYVESDNEKENIYEGSYLWKKKVQYWNYMSMFK